MQKASILLTAVAWNAVFLILRYSQVSALSVCGYAYCLGLISLKLLLHTGLLPSTVDLPLGDYSPALYDKVNSFCGKLHKQLRGWGVLVFVWAGVKLAVYGRVLGTFGLCLVGGNVVLLQKAVKEFVGVNLLETVLATRRKVISWVLERISSLRGCESSPSPS